MNELILHLEFLLHSHNCVIVPKLGGFVVNTTPVKRDGLSNFYAPVSELVFNRDLTYNDGLLIESFMRVEKISSDAAQQKIKSAVKEIKETLRNKKEVSLGDLGFFKVTDESELEYTSLPFVRPEHYGMNMASLQPVLQLKPKVTESTAEVQEKEKLPQRTYMWRNLGIATAAAAVIVFILTLFPVQDTIHHQTAQVLTEKKLFGSKKQSKQSPVAVQKATDDISLANETKLIDNDISSTIQITDKAEHNNPAITTTETNTPQYYVITGVYEMENYAMNMLSQLNEEGYSNASTFMKHGRINVYSASYPTIEEAYNALNILIQKNENHSDAWILKK